MIGALREIEMAPTQQPSPRPSLRTGAPVNAPTGPPSDRVALVCGIVSAIVLLMLSAVGYYWWRRGTVGQQKQQLEGGDRTQQGGSVSLSRTKSKERAPSITPQRIISSATSINPMATRQATLRASKKVPSIVDQIVNIVPFEGPTRQDDIPLSQTSSL